LIDSNEVISITEVQEEITSSEHKTFWNKINEKHNNTFYNELIYDEIEEFPKNRKIKNLFKDNFKKYPYLKVEWSLQKEWGEGIAIADHLLVCHGLKHNSTIVTTESPRKQYNIPHVCKELKVDCIGIKEFFLENELQF
jgi:hypothetical protein